MSGSLAWQAFCTARGMAQQNIGISNRVTPEEEARERETHPPVLPDAPPDSLTEEFSTEEPDVSDAQRSTKSGTRSDAQKAERSKYVERTAPQVEKKAGAFGKESK